MVLGNTFHLMLNPGAELIERFGGLHRFMGWEGPIITDSGGFQVFSMGHGTVADEIKSRGARAGQGEAQRREGAILSIEEQGVRFRSYVDGASASSHPRTRWRCRPRFTPISRSCSTSAPPFMSIATTPSARPSAPIAG